MWDDVRVRNFVGHGSRGLQIRDLDLKNSRFIFRKVLWVGEFASQEDAMGWAPAYVENIDNVGNHLLPASASPSQYITFTILSLLDD